MTDDPRIEAIKAWIETTDLASGGDGNPSSEWDNAFIACMRQVVERLPDILTAADAADPLRRALDDILLKQLEDASYDTCAFFGALGVGVGGLVGDGGSDG